MSTGPMTTSHILVVFKQECLTSSRSGLVSCASSIILQLPYVITKIVLWGRSHMSAFHSIHEACLTQGSPSTFTPTDRESFRRGSSVTSWRAGKDGKPYLYTLNLACPEERWAELAGLYHKAADSFKLTPPTKVSA